MTFWAISGTPVYLTVECHKRIGGARENGYFWSIATRILNRIFSGVIKFK